MLNSRIMLAGVLAAGLAGCQEQAAPEPSIRPVRAVTVERSVAGEPVSLTGHVRAQDQVSFAFRLDGRLMERRVGVGDAIRPGQVSDGSTRRSSRTTCSRRRPICRRPKGN